MPIGGLFIGARIESSFSLKDKRKVVSSIKDRVRRRFNVSISEMGDNEIVNFVRLAVCCVGNSYGLVDRTLDSVLRFIESHYDVEIVEIERLRI